MPGVGNYGIVSIQVVPREWVDGTITIDFATGRVVDPILLLPGRDWITLEFTQPSYDYEEKSKSNKSGSYYEITCGGILNYNDADTMQVLETLRYHQLVAIVKDREKRLRLVGDNDNGLTLSKSFKQQNINSGTEVVQIDMMMESERSAPYYVP